MILSKTMVASTPYQAHFFLLRKNSAKGGAITIMKPSRPETVTNLWTFESEGAEDFMDCVLAVYGKDGKLAGMLGRVDGDVDPSVHIFVLLTTSIVDIIEPEFRERFPALYSQMKENESDGLEALEDLIFSERRPCMSGRLKEVAELIVSDVEGKLAFCFHSMRALPGKPRFGKVYSTKEKNHMQNSLNEILCQGLKGVATEESDEEEDDEDQEDEDQEDHEEQKKLEESPSTSADDDSDDDSDGSDDDSDGSDDDSDGSDDDSDDSDDGSDDGDDGSDGSDDDSDGNDDGNDDDSDGSDDDSDGSDDDSDNALLRIIKFAATTSQTQNSSRRGPPLAVCVERQKSTF